MTKRIAILVNSLNSGGAEKLTSLMVENLNKKHALFLILMNDTIKYDLKGFQNIHLIENSKLNESGLFKFLKLPLIAWRYKNYCKSNNIDISISILSRSNYVSTISKLFGNKSKIVISEHSVPSKQYGSNTIKSKINKLLIRKLYNIADKIVTVSKGSAIDLRDKFFITKKIDIVPNSIDLKDISVKSQENVNFNFSKFTYITVGRLDAAKNHKLMIESFSKLNVDAQLLIIGEGVLKDYLLSLIYELKLDKKVFLLGYQENPYKYLSRSDCFLFTSNYESFGIVLLEAMACGLPIISTDCECGPREILGKSGEYGILVATNNIENLYLSMDYIYKDTFIKLFFKKKSCERVKHFINQDFEKGYL